ncbi:MAG: peptidoglycan editing factor PgeF [Candidatus Kapaibacteriota bacterium]
MDFRIIEPQIFPKEEIIAGVTERNQHLFLSGFSFASNEYFDEETATKHRKILAEVLGASPKDFAYLRQTHSDIIHLVDDDYQTKEGDALVTSVTGKILVVKIADCAGILLYDPVRKVVSAVHSGWRGSYKRIVQKTILTMETYYKSRPDEILVWVSPLASAERYEVGEDVARLFPKTAQRKENGTYYFDNMKEIENQLLEVGILKENIEISAECTISNLKLHSYRRDGKKSGRMACFIGMKK